MSSLNKTKVSVRLSENCYKVWWHLDDKKFPFAKEFCFQDDLTKESAWDEALRFALDFETELIKSFK